MIVAALQALLAASNEVAPRLARYDFGAAAEEPAIFVADVPEDAKDPCISLALDGVEEVAQTRAGKHGEEHSIEVVVWGGNDRTETAVRLLALTVARVIRKATLDLSAHGFDCQWINVKGPGRARSVDGYAGFAMIVTAVAHEV